MRKILITTVLLICAIVTNAQKADSKNAEPPSGFSLGIGAVNTSFVQKSFFGAYLDLKYYAAQRWATGLSLSIAQRKITDTFSYSIGQPLLTFYEIGWVNQYDFFQKDNLRIGLSLNNGMAIARLGDNTQKERYRTRYGYQKRAKEIETNYLYLLQPGLDISYKVYSDKDGLDIYATSKAQYRVVLGNPKFGQTNDFSNYWLGAGITIITN